MKLTEVITCLTEGTSGRGSSEGRKAYASKSATKDDKKKSFKGRVKTYDSIKSALADGSYGQIFSTKAAGII